MSTRKIEHLDEQTILGDNDLVFTSVSNGSGYDSKKVTLASIANYVKSTLGSTGGNEQPTGGNEQPTVLGYEIYDTSESGDGTCNSQEELDAYCADDSRNLLFDLPMYASSGAPYADFVVKHLEKTVSKDCLVVFDAWVNLKTTYTTSGDGLGGDVYVTGDGYDLPDQSRAYSVFIDDKQIRLQNFVEQDQGVKFYLKAGQKITIDIPSNWGGGHVSIIPLKSGGKFFIDTTKSGEYFKKGQMTALKTSTSNSRYTYTYTNDLDCTVLFCSRFPDSFTDFDDRSTASGETYVTINGKKVHIDSPSYSGAIPEAANTHIILEPGDTFQINTTKAFSSSYACYYQWNVYPLLDNGSVNDFDDTDPEPIVVEDEPEQPDEPVSTTKASISGAATCTANASSNSTSLTLGITQKTPETASLQYAISTSKTSVPTSWTNASVTNNKLTRSISFTAKTTQTKYLFIKVSGDGYEDSTYYVGIRQAYSETTTSSTTYSTKTQQIIASSLAAARYQRNTLVAAHPEWVNPSDVYGSHNVWYFTYQVPSTTSTTTGTYGHSISEPLTLVS